ncbi:MAG TPA: cyclic nucleotide-binding domain-containing protein [Polyangiales bacterium]|nr:cyclic nucleotide-binding domain-containing protein [Polyangiales bacterium]
MSHTSATSLGVSPLDRAHAARLAGALETALQLAASILTAAPADAGAAWLVARLLADGNRLPPARIAATELVSRFVRRGDLPSACLCAHLVGDAGGAAAPLLAAIAKVFGRGSSRLGAVSPAPPPLPHELEAAPFFANLSGAALYDAAEQTLARALAQKDPLADGPVPRLPLFSELAPPVLHKLLQAFQLREFAKGGFVVCQGEEGLDAFLLARGVLNVVRERDEGSVVLAVLGPGALFGEMSLVSNAPRAASVVAVEPAHVFAAPRQAIEALSAKEPTIGRTLGEFCHQRMISNLLRHSSILSAVEPARRAELIGHFTPRTFQLGAVLVRQDEEAGRLFLIASGGVEVRRTDVDGDKVVLAQLGPGDVVGEISLVLRRPATADVVAVHTTVALELTSEQFQEAIREYPGLLQELYDLAIKRDDETRSVVAQAAVDVSDTVLL